MFPDPFTYLKFLLNVHQNPSRTPSMAINSLNNITKQHHCNKTPMATKQFSRYPSTKFHKQAKSTFASEIYGTVHKPQQLFFLHLSELSTAIQDNYPQKP